MKTATTTLATILACVVVTAAVYWWTKPNPGELLCAVPGESPGVVQSMVLTAGDIVYRDGAWYLDGGNIVIAGTVCMFKRK